MSAIFNDETGIEYVKKEGARRNMSKMYLLKEVFGQGKCILNQVTSPSLSASAASSLSALSSLSASSSSSDTYLLF